MSVNWAALIAMVTFFFAPPAAAQAFAIRSKAQAVRWAKSCLARLCEFHNANALTPQCA
jgi:hypothetical protein